MSHRRIKLKTRVRAAGAGEFAGTSQAGDGPIWETWDREAYGEFCFTALLNAALELFMKDPKFTDVARVDVWTMRFAWGNWYPYAVKGGEYMAMPTFPKDRPMLEEVLLGKGPCPFCGKAADEAFMQHLPSAFRWHRKCLAHAFARDAVRFGDPKQKEWGATVLKQ